MNNKTYKCFVVHEADANKVKLFFLLYICIFVFGVKLMTIFEIHNSFVHYVFAINNNLSLMEIHMYLLFVKTRKTKVLLQRKLI